MKLKVLFIFCSFLSMGIALSQNTIELLGAPGSGGPVTIGPATSNQTVTLFTNSTTPHNPVITATYSLSNQQFDTIEGNPTTPGVVFGNNLAAVGDTNLVPAPGSGVGVYQLMNYAGSPQNTHYTACYTCAVGTGISVATNRGIEMQSFADALIDGANNNLQPVTARVYYADLTITFNRPVTNPVLHFAGLGANFFYTAPDGNYYTHGYATEFDLMTTGVTLKRLSGSTKFDVTGNTIKDTAASLGASALGSIVQSVLRYGAGGSVAVLGTNITSLTFRMYIQGDAGAVINPSTGMPTAPTPGREVKWAAAKGGSIPKGSLQGDVFTIGISLQDPVDITGNVFNDPDGGNVNNSTPVANLVPGDMYINLVDSNNVVVASAPVNTDGSYTLPMIFEGTYTAVLSTSNLPPGSTPVSTKASPGWYSTGEFTGAPNTGSDGNIDGTSAAFTVTGTDLNNVNFGIRPLVLSATFADVSATLTGNGLQVKWSTLTESNNSHFDIEISTDGKTFTKLGTVKSQAVNGSSSQKLDYTYQAAVPASFAFAAFAFLALLPAFKKRRWALPGLLFIALLFLNSSCNKSTGIEVEAGSKLFVRIAQVDVDGTKTYSKIVAVTKD